MIGQDDLEIIFEMDKQGLVIAKGINENGRETMLIYRQKTDDFGNVYYAVSEEVSPLERAVIKGLLSKIKEIDEKASDV